MADVPVVVCLQNTLHRRMIFSGKRGATSDTSACRRSQMCIGTTEASRARPIIYESNGRTSNTSSCVEIGNQGCQRHSAVRLSTNTTRALGRYLRAAYRQMLYYNCTDYGNAVSSSFSSMPVATGGNLENDLRHSQSI